MTVRRALWALLAMVLVAAVWSAWLAWQVRGDLRAVQRSAEDLEAALTDGDRAAQERALGDLRRAAADAHGHTDSVWWDLMTHVPLVGDDAEGAQALGASVDVVAAEGAGPLLRVYRQADGLTGSGGIDLAVVERMRGDVAAAHAAFAEAADLVRGLDSSGYAGPVRGRFDQYVDVVTEADRTLASAETAVEVLPAMLGGEGPRDYLLLFQNNAEIRATGGMPGAWAQVHADDGRLSLARQGTAGDFPFRQPPPTPLTASERAIYDAGYGQYFQNVGLAPDWPRAAELARGHWDARFPGVELDGVLGIDPVAMGYLMEGTGPITVGGRELTADNAVEGLLSLPYLELDPQVQDAFFAGVARALFDHTVGGLADPVAFAGALARAAGEDRLFVAAFDEEVDAALVGADVRGALSGDDGDTPHVDIGLNDATQSKMSYYLRYQAEVRATGCRNGRQRLMATMRLNQTIEPEQARRLSESVTGSDRATLDLGEQLVFVRVYGPHGGTVDDIRIDGRALELEPVEDRGRPVITVLVQLTNTDDVVLSWAMDTGPGQSADGVLGMTPSVTPGSKSGTFASAC